MNITGSQKTTQNGQGTVELILALFAFFTVAFMYFQVAISFGVANYFQYVTFMASRALLSGAKDEVTQIKAGTAIFEKMLQNGGKEIFKGIAKGIGEGDLPGAFVGRSSRVALKGGDARDKGWEQGATYKFAMKMYLIPMVAGAKKGKANQIILQSESWLGREPSEEECLSTLEYRKNSKSKLEKGSSFIYDNGC